MKNFFETFKSSFYSPEFYKQLNTRSLKSTFGYFFLFILLLTIIRAVSLYNPLVNEAPKALKKSADELINCYPDNLEVNISKGEASTSAKQPYFLSCDKSKPASESAFLVIDTNTPFSKEKFDEYKTPMYLTKNALVARKNDIETNTYSLEKVRDLKINKNEINNLYKKALSYFIYIGPGLLSIVSIFIYIGYISRLLYLLALSPLIFLISNYYMKKNLSYFQIYKTSLFAIIPALSVELLLDLTKPWTHFGGFPFMFTIITLGIFYINLKDKIES